VLEDGAGGGGAEDAGHDAPVAAAAGADDVAYQVSPVPGGTAGRPPRCTLDAGETSGWHPRCGSPTLSGQHAPLPEEDVVMGILDKLFGTARPPERSTREAPQDSAPGPSADDQAIERYQYLLRTAPPEALEQAHAEAFARLTPEQRAEVLRRFSSSLPPAELADARSGDPRALARAATRAEVQSPGFMERTLGRGGMGMGMGGGLGGGFGSSLLGSLAGSFIGTAIASQFMHGFAPGLGFMGDARADTSDRNFSDVESGHGTTDADGGVADASGDDGGSDDSGGFDDGGDLDD
jgi:hypothetical protein